MTCYLATGQSLIKRHGGRAAAKKPRSTRHKYGDGNPPFQRGLDAFSKNIRIKNWLPLMY